MPLSKYRSAVPLGRAGIAGQASFGGCGADSGHAAWGLWVCEGPLQASGPSPPISSVVKV